MKNYLNIPDDYEVLFMQGGGSGEFSGTVYNMIGIWVERRRQKLIKDLGITADQENRLLEELRQAVETELKMIML